MNMPLQGEAFYQRWWFWVLIIIAFPILFNAVTKQETQPVATVASTESASAHVFDVPPLLDMTIDEVGEALGTPSDDSEPTADQLRLGTRTWEKTWSRDDHYLLVTYDVQTRQVVDVFLGTNSDAAFESFRDTDNILKAANLAEHDSRLDIEFVKALRGGGYTGAIVRKI